MSKIYTPEEAAKAVLKKAEEMLKSSKLNKCGPMAKQEANQDSTIAMNEKDQSPAQGVENSGIDQHSVDSNKENGNPVWGSEPGCHKLSKFMGRREERKKAKPAQSIPEKEIK